MLWRPAKRTDNEHCGHDETYCDRTRDDWSDIQFSQKSKVVHGGFLSNWYQRRLTYDFLQPHEWEQLQGLPFWHWHLEQTQTVSLLHI